jgi:hypothetical protein
MGLEAVVVDEDAFFGLVDSRASELACFLQWAASCEAREPDSAVRFEHRAEIERCRSLLDRFHEPWWGVVVYSCFDSIQRHRGGRVCIRRTSSAVEGGTRHPKP